MDKYWLTSLYGSLFLLFYGDLCYWCFTVLLFATSYIKYHTKSKHNSISSAHKIVSVSKLSPVAFYSYLLKALSQNAKLVRKKLAVWFFFFFYSKQNTFYLAKENSMQSSEFYVSANVAVLFSLLQRLLKIVCYFISFFSPSTSYLIFLVFTLQLSLFPFFLWL